MLFEIWSIQSTNFVNYMWTIMCVKPLHSEAMAHRANCPRFEQLQRQHIFLTLA